MYSVFIDISLPSNITSTLTALKVGWEVFLAFLVMSRSGILSLRLLLATSNRIPSLLRVNKEQLARVRVI